MPSRLRRHDEQGHIHFWTISCSRRLGFFFHDAMKGIVCDGLALLQTKFRVCLIGYVVMPEHIHVLLYPHPQGSDEPLPISKLLNAFKQHVGFHGKRWLREYWREHSRLWSDALTDWAVERTDGEKAIWNTRGYDFNIDRHETLLQKLDYCHKNPMNRGLIDRPEDWPWSSFRYYEFDDRSLLAMDWEGSWPILW